MQTAFNGTSKLILLHVTLWLLNIWPVTRSIVVSVTTATASTPSNANQTLVVKELNT